MSAAAADLGNAAAVSITAMRSHMVKRFDLIMGDEQRCNRRGRAGSSRISWRMASRSLASRFDRHSSSSRTAGLDHQRAGESDALLLAAGELAWAPLAEMAELDHGRAPSRNADGRSRPLADAALFQAEGDVGGRRRDAETARRTGRRSPCSRLCAGSLRDLGAVDAGSCQRSGAIRPASMRRVVVLPQPEGPSRATDSPCADRTARRRRPRPRRHSASVRPGQFERARRAQAGLPVAGRRSLSRRQRLFHWSRTSGPWRPSPPGIIRRAASPVSCRGPGRPRLRVDLRASRSSARRTCAR